MSAKVTEYDNVGMSSINRCDRCGTQAHVEVLLPSTSVLLFCAHHYSEHEEKLVETAVEILDHRKWLIEQEKQRDKAKSAK